jgi:uncharacterized heparinase superfamily protein
MERPLLLIRTLAYLRPGQVFAQVLKRVLPSSRVRPTRHAGLRPGVSIGSCLQSARPTAGDYSFCFLNRGRIFPAAGIDWAGKEMPKLWRYNLHYFDYLFDTARTEDGKGRIISDWIAKNPMGAGDGWEPYTVSLRVVNWIKFFLLHEKFTQEPWMLSLYAQVAWLERNLEHHILANHYLKNAVALFFAGMYFKGGDADRWLKKGWAMLWAEGKEQFLPDGGHYERSPMYHSICLVDYLDVLNLVQNSRAPFQGGETAWLQRVVAVGLDFLHHMSLPDRNIPLFNDSAFGIAPSPAQIFGYAKQVTGYETPATAGGIALYAQADSGYYVCRNGGDAIVIDCGPIGPDYQPGHAHCDTLSYELAIDARRVVVDSGVYDYEASSERVYARSTRAHNTVVVDGEEQSEIWGVFRVARRAKPLGASFRRSGDGMVIFEGAHDGYRRLPGTPVHSRKVSYDGRGSWVIEDRLEGRGRHRMDSHVHIHPDFHVARTGACLDIIAPDGRAIAVIEPLSTSDTRVEQGWYFPEFGVKHKNDVIVFSRSHDAPFELRYRIRKAAGVHRQDGSVT